jgi:hypothetical protein
MDTFDSFWEMDSDKKLNLKLNRPRRWRRCNLYFCSVPFVGIFNRTVNCVFVIGTIRWCWLLSKSSMNFIEPLYNSMKFVSWLIITIMFKILYQDKDFENISFLPLCKICSLYFFYSFLARLFFFEKLSYCRHSGVSVWVWGQHSLQVYWVSS